MKSIFAKNSQAEGTPTPLTSKEALAFLLGEAVLIDIRPEYETSLRSFNVPKVVNISNITDLSIELCLFDSIMEKVQVISKEIPVIVADSVGTRSKEAALNLCSLGYTQVAYLSGGMVEWERAELPIAKDVNYEMIGGCACRIHPQGTTK